MIELSKNISDYVLNTFGEEYFKKFAEFVETDHITYLRLPGQEDNRLKLAKKLYGRYGIELEQHNSVPFAYKVIAGNDKIGKTLEYTIGKYYIQSLSSMIPPMILNPTENDITMDLCAAPGSKSTQLAGMMNNTGTLYSNEPSPKRIKSLVYNLDRLGIVNMGVIQKYGELLSKNFSGYFDKILVDAPCSGLGIVQKKGEISNWWTEKSASRLSDTQLRLLISAIKMSKPGAEIVYSTCTLTVEENELVLNTILKKYPVELVEIDLPVKSHPALTEYEGVKLNPEISKARRIIPWEVNSEGFFIAKLRKTDSTEEPDKTDIKNRNIKLVHSKHRDIKEHIKYVGDYYGIPLSELERFNYIMKSRDINFVNADWKYIDPNLFVRIGTKFGTVDKRGACHINTLAIQSLESHISRNIVELDEVEDLKTYMSGGTIKRITNLRGQQIIKFEDDLIGTATASEDGLKSQYPRAMRTHEIILD